MSEEFELVYSKATGFSRRSLPAPPTLRSDEVLLRPKWIGICGSDLYTMEVHEGELRLGHEWLGIIEKTGPDAKSLKPGDAVTSTATFGCLKCTYCLERRTNLCCDPIHLGSDKMGALRSWIVISEKNLVKVAEIAAKDQVLHEVIAVAEECMNLVLSNRETQDRELLILGAGPVGLLIALIARGKGFSPILVEKNPYRIDVGKARGLETVSFAQALIDPKLSRRFTTLVDASSDFNNDTGGFKYIPTFMKQEFLAVLVGKYVVTPEIPRSFYKSSGKLVWMRGVTLKTLGNSVSSWEPRRNALSQGLITHTFPAAQVGAAFDIARKKSESMKVVIEL